MCLCSMQVNTALDEAVAKHCHQRLLDETLELVLSKVPGVGPLLQVLVDVQASVQLAEMYDIRDAITHRNPGGFANIQGPLAQKVSVVVLTQNSDFAPHAEQTVLAYSATCPTMVGRVQGWPAI